MTRPRSRLYFEVHPAGRGLPVMLVTVYRLRRARKYGALGRRECGSFALVFPRCGIDGTSVATWWRTPNTRSSTLRRAAHVLHAITAACACRSSSSSTPAAREHKHEQ